MTERPVFDRPRDDQDQAPTGPTVHDKRRIDPDTYEVREPQTAAAPGPGDTGNGASPSPEDAGVAVETTADPQDAAGTQPVASAEEPAEVAELKAALADRTADLQRLQAEYVNYKRRVDRDRDLARAGGVESVLRELLSVLDNVRSARQHEELSAGFRAVADDIERVTGKHGLIVYGETGDAFDPHIHEALMHVPAPEGEELTRPTCVQILQAGYRIGERVIRPARVAVADPS